MADLVLLLLDSKRTRNDFYNNFWVASTPSVGQNFAKKNVTSFMDGPWRGRGLRIGDDHQGLRGWAFSPFGKGPYSKPVLGVGSCKGNEPFIKIKPSSSGLSGLWFGKGPCSKSAFVWCREHETKDLLNGISKLISFFSFCSKMSTLQLLFQNHCKLWHYQNIYFWVFTIFHQQVSYETKLMNEVRKLLECFKLYAMIGKCWKVKFEEIRF